MLVLWKKGNALKVRAQVPGDLWHLEKVIKPGDVISGSTVRKYVADSGNQERKNVFIRMSVEKVSFHADKGTLRVLGLILEGTPEDLVPVREHHTFDLGEADAVTIEKQEWMGYELDRIREAERNVRRTKLSVLVLDDSDAELYHIKEYGIEFGGEAHAKGTGKYRGKEDDSKKRYHAEISKLIGNAETLIIAGPGFEKDAFRKYANDSGLKLNAAFEPVSSTGKGAISELVENGRIDAILKGSRFAEETKIIDNFIRLLARGKVAYGPEEVKTALEQGAVDQLLVVDSLLFTGRDMVEGLSRLAAKAGSQVIFLSNENEASQKISAFGGIAATLRYALGKS